MAMVNMRDLIYHAYTNRYAVCSFDVMSVDILSGLLGAAEQCRSPIVLNVTAACLKHYNIEMVMAVVERVALRTQVPVAIQLDNTTTAGEVCLGMKHGCNSVMFNASEVPLPINIQKTQEITALAHQCGIAVEGMLGYIKGPDGTDSGHHTDNESITSSYEARAFVERTRVDFLAVTIGGGNSTRKSRTKLDFQRLAKIHQTIEIPLVIHEDHELSDDQHFKLISNGVARINYAAKLFDIDGARTSARGVYIDSTSYSNYIDTFTETVKNKAEKYMHLCGSTGRAAEVLMQCQPWKNVEHVIIYNTSLTRDADIQRMISKGMQELSRIPGVREVTAGKSIDANSKFAYTWLIKFCAPEVVEYYKENPVHKQFADNVFRPIASERITTDFELVNFDDGSYFNPVDYRAVG